MRVGIHFRTESTYEKDLMAENPLTGNANFKAEMEYHGKFGHTIGWIQHISIMSRIEICYSSCRLETQTMSPTLPSFQGLNRCIQYMYSHTLKPILYPYNYYYITNFIILIWSGNKLE